MPPPLRIGSLCTGYGGLDMAAEAYFGGRTAWVSDIDKGACKILAHRYPHAPNIGDLKKVDWLSLEPVEVLTAGYPCQPFSKSGNRKGTNDPRHLWPYIREAVRCLRPAVTLLENVAGHRSLGFDRVLGDMADDGLHVRWASVRASDVGATHERERLFITVTDPGRERHGQGEDDQPLGRVGGRYESEAPERERARAESGDRTSQDWGRYGDAVHRWERVTGRAAPAPVIDPEHENPAFVEWMMGLPSGWVSEVPGLSWSHQLKALGNGVVPQQAFEALRRMGV